MSPTARLLPALLLAAIVSCHVGNGNVETAAGPDAIAEIRGQPVTLSAFNAWVAGVAPGSADAAGAGEPAGPSRSELMSRLLDRFLDEELIVREAAKSNVEVTEREVTESLRRLQRPEGAEGGIPREANSGEEASSVPAGRDPAQGARERMRRSLLVKKFREEKILKDLTVGPPEVAAWYDDHKDQFGQSAHVVLRQILLEDAAAAAKVRDDLVKDPGRFEEIAQAQSMAPDGGRARAYDEADLDPSIVAAAAAVPDGGITGVVTDAMGSRIFKVEKRQAARVVGLAEASDRIRVALLQEKGKKGYESYMDTLRQASGLVIHEDRLPFGYRKKAS
jgi:foldase protein PrsA